MTRHTADSITDPVLDDLYGRLVQIRQLAGDALIGFHTSPAPAVPVRQRADCTELEWAQRERDRMERLYTRESARADKAEREVQQLREQLAAAEYEAEALGHRASRYRAQRDEARRQLADTREKRHRWAEEADIEIRALRERAEQAEAALDRVRALHSRFENKYVGYDTCNGCELNNNELVPWPCPTIRELDGTEAAPAPAGAEATEGTAFRRRCAGLARNADDFADAYRKVVTDRAAIRASDEPEPRPAPRHIGGGANAEDCPACGPETPYPFICPGNVATDERACPTPMTHNWSCGCPTDQDRPDPRCICGDPIQLMDDTDPTSWIHTPGSDTRCTDARPAAEETR
ncbi:hypothetical protein [Streptomyces sp. NPDC002644]